MKLAAITSLVATMATLTATTTLTEVGVNTAHETWIEPGNESVQLFTPTKPGFHSALIEFEGFGYSQPSPAFAFDIPKDAVGKTTEIVVRNPGDSMAAITSLTFSDDEMLGTANPLCVVHGYNTDLSAETYINLDSGTQWRGRDFEVCAIPEPKTMGLILLASLVLIARRRR
jgi:hypothetical protein